MADRQGAVYRALLILYPRSFRDSYGEPMAQLFDDRRRDRGRRVWLETAPDLLRTVPVQRMEAAMAALGPQARIAVPAIGALAAATVAAAFGGGAIPLIVVVAVVVLLLRRHGVASAIGARAPLWPATTQAWWAPVAAVLGLATGILGVATVFTASNLGGRIVGSSLLMGLGVLMAVGLMRRPFDRSAGNIMVLIATIPSLMLFWVIVPTIAAVVVWIGVLGAGFSDERLVNPRPYPTPD